MLTAKRAFQRASPVESMSAVLNEEPVDPLVANPALPPAAAVAVRRCLEKNKEERFQSARDLAFHLTHLVQATMGAQAPPVGRRLPDAQPGCSPGSPSRPSRARRGWRAAAWPGTRSRSTSSSPSTAGRIGGARFARAESAIVYSQALGVGGARSASRALRQPGVAPTGPSRSRRAGHAAGRARAVHPPPLHRRRALLRHPGHRPHQRRHPQGADARRRGRGLGSVRNRFRGGAIDRLRRRTAGSSTRRARGCTRRRAPSTRFASRRTGSAWRSSRTRPASARGERSGSSTATARARSSPGTGSARAAWRGLRAETRCGSPPPRPAPTVRCARWT